MGEVPVVMQDPFPSAVAGKATELAVEGGKGACAALVRLVRDRLGGDKDATAALVAASGHPQDNDAVAALAQALQRLTAQDRNSERGLAVC